MFVIVVLLVFLFTIPLASEFQSLIYRFAYSSLAIFLRRIVVIFFPPSHLRVSSNPGEVIPFLVFTIVLRSRITYYCTVRVFVSSHSIDLSTLIDSQYDKHIVMMLSSRKKQIL